MPLTPFQDAMLAVLSHARNDDRYLAGGAALHFAPNSARFSDDLDFFHDSEARVASTFATDRKQLEVAGYAVTVEISQPGLIRALVSLDGAATRVDWAHDSAWRFLPLERDPSGALLMHPVDLAVNKVLALAGRDEARDFLDIMYINERVLPLGALIWAATGKDPGFSPLSLLELLKRRGRYQQSDFDRLSLAEPFDLPAAKTGWLNALAEADAFVRSRPADETGCLYWSAERRMFVEPRGDEAAPPHYGRPGGVLPQAR